MSDWLLSTLWYGSLGMLLAGVVAIIRPVRWLGLRTRWRAAAAIVVAPLLIAGNAVWTPRTQAVFLAQSSIDTIVPAYQFRETHSLIVDARPASVMRAVKTVAADEIALFQSLTAIRRLGRSAPEGLMNAPDGKPIIEVATRTGFLLLAEDAREVVLGAALSAPDAMTRAQVRDARSFQELTGPRVIKVALNFRTDETPNGATRLTTETRVFCSDTESIRRFTPYWRTIFPGSWIMRANWLRAIARRAEADRPSPIAQPTGR